MIIFLRINEFFKKSEDYLSGNTYLFELHINGYISYGTIYGDGIYTEAPRLFHKNKNKWFETLEPQEKEVVIWEL